MTAKRRAPRLSRDAAGGLLTEGRARLVRHLAQPGASQAALAEKLGCSRSMICMIATGHRIPSGYELVTGLCAELGLVFDDWHRPPASNGTVVNKNGATTESGAADAA